MANVIIRSIGAFDASVSATIYFDVIGNTSVVASNTLKIYNSNNQQVGSDITTASASYATVPANTVTNGNMYYAQISAYDSNNVLLGQSTKALFWAVTNPTITYIEPSSATTINETNYTTQLSYTITSATGVPDNFINDYQFDLYDSNNNLIQSSGKIYGSGTQSGTAFLIDNEFTNLSLNTTYYIICSINTTLGTHFETTSSNITVSNNVPQFPAPTLENNCLGGYINITVTNASWTGGAQKFLIKRKVDSTSNWVTVGEYIPTTPSASTFSFTLKDYSAVHGTVYKYKIVPVVNGDEKDGVQSASITPIFDGLYICNKDKSVRIEANMGYGEIQLVQLTGTHETITNKYPIIVSNSNVKYRMGSIVGMVLNADFYTNGLDRKGIVEAREAVGEFLVDGEPKMIKDMNGNAWFVEITEGVASDFVEGWGMGLANITASWVEIGTESDLTRIGFISKGEE